MRIEVKGRNVAVTDELRECVARRFERVGKQVADVAVLTVEIGEDRDASPTTSVAEAALRLKGVTLRASEASRDPKHAISLVADDMSRQVKRHRDKRRNRREARASAAQPAPAEPPVGDASPPPGSLPAT
jgi:putative sigma-54 modulation protein